MGGRTHRRRTASVSLLVAGLVLSGLGFAPLAWATFEGEKLAATGGGSRTLQLTGLAVLLLGIGTYLTGKQRERQPRPVRISAPYVAPKRVFESGPEEGVLPGVARPGDDASSKRRRLSRYLPHAYFTFLGVSLLVTYSRFYRRGH